MKDTSQTNTNLPDTSGAAYHLPRLAMINSMAGFGRCSTAISLPVISAMQVQVCPIPTAILSNHLGFPTWHKLDYTPYMRDYLQAWKQLGLTFDGLYCGFLGNMEQIEIVKEFLDTFRPPLFFLDPVMGDNGKTFSTITPEYCTALKRLLPYADIIVPNITEACFLTDTLYKDGPWLEYELKDLCKKLSELCPGKIIITGLQNTNAFLNYIWENGHRSTYVSPIAGRASHGTGDLFASIVVANALHHRDLLSSVKQAADFVATCIRGREEMGLLTAEGVPFERYLYMLTDSSI